MNSQENIEKRSAAGEGFEVRMSNKDKREIEGYGIVFNKRFEIWSGYFEEIAEEAGEYFKRAGIDVIGAFNHNFDKILGRTVSGTMRFEVDETGVKYIIQVAKTTYGDDVLESVERGDVSGSSFVFRTKAVEYKEESDTVSIRRIKEFSDVIEMGPVVRPAYTDTTVAKRSAEERAGKTENLKKQIEQEKIKRADSIRKMRLAAYL